MHASLEKYSYDYAEDQPEGQLYVLVDQRLIFLLFSSFGSAENEEGEGEEDYWLKHGYYQRNKL